MKPDLEEDVPTRPVRRHLKNQKAIDLAREQYRQLRESLAAAPDVQEKNVIFRRLINLLDVMSFLNSDSGVNH